MSTIAAVQRGPASVSEFAQWLTKAGETEGLDRQRLWLLFGEFVLDADAELITQPQLHRRARAAGIERYRLPTGRREWRYRVRSTSALKHEDRRQIA